MTKAAARTLASLVVIMAGLAPLDPAPASPRLAVASISSVSSVSSGNDAGVSVALVPDTLPDASASTADPDAPDAVEGMQTHVIYFVPEDRPNEGLHTDGTLARSIDAMRAWFRRETSDLGMPSIHPRMDVVADGTYDISFVRGNKASGEYTAISLIAGELIERGYNGANKRYLVYAAARADEIGNPGGRCGEAYYPLPTMEMRQYAVVYLDANEGCGARDFATGPGENGAQQAEMIAAHEWLHNEGITPLTAPHACLTSFSHSCTGPLWMLPKDDTVGGYLDPEFEDVMFPVVTGPLKNKSLDRDRDDYLDHPWLHIDLRDSAWMT